MTVTRKSFRSQAIAASIHREMAYAKEEFARRLRLARERARLSQEDAAHRAGVSDRQWVRWETGKAMPYHSTLEKIAQALRVDPADLTGETNPAPLGLGTDGAATRLEQRLVLIESSLIDLHTKLDELLLRQPAPDELDEMTQAAHALQTQDQAHPPQAPRRAARSRAPQRPTSA